jgi:23S rRNA (adenine2503-C2)-methyltransferase
MSLAELVTSGVRPSLVGLTRAGLGDALASIGVPEREIRMRVNQLWHWIYFQGVSDFDRMTNVAKALRGKLAEHFTLARPEVVAEQVSNDGTRKWLIRLPATGKEKPAEIECVYIPESDRGTLCVSSQVGCTLTCTFCHTGTQKLVRNLTSQEIVQQLVVARDRIGDFPGLTPPTDGLLRLASCRMVMACLCPSAASQCPRQALCRRSRPLAKKRAQCSRFRFMLCAMICAIRLCR